MSDSTVRVCEGCGEQYDPVQRGTEGGFHFLVMSVEHDPDGSLSVVGHWRTGLAPDGVPVELRRTDGHRVTITELVILPGASEASERKGQRVLTVRTTTPDSFQAGGCIRPVSEQLPIWAR